MKPVHVLVIRAAGINCDEECVHAWRVVGAQTQLVHINRLIETPSMLDDVSIVTIPGGFSYGDDIAAGAILAQRIKHGLLAPLRSLVQRGGGILGICNGFQVLVKAGLLPGDAEGNTEPRALARAEQRAEPQAECNPDSSGARADKKAVEQTVTVTFNDSAKFEARWVTLEVCTDRCVFLKAGTTLEMPVEHAEGKVYIADQSEVARLERGGQIAVRYVDAKGDHESYPANPNGSVSGIAGLCDITGRIFGLMPHPDRHFAHTQHPLSTRREPDGSPDGLTVFENAMECWGR